MRIGENPICKVPLKIENIDSNLLITTLFDDDTDVENDNAAADDDGTPGATPVPAGARCNQGVKKQYDDDMMTRSVRTKRSDNKQIKALTSHVIAQQRELSTLKSTVVQNHDIQLQSNKIMNRNVVHIMKAAAFCVTPGTRRVGAAVITDNSVAIRALQNTVYKAEQAVRYRKESTNTRLSSHPRCLHMLWNKKEFGIGVNKAAKLFTPEERGAVKHKYCLRKIFWDTVGHMVLRGWSAITACGKIKDMYSDHSSMSKILVQMRNDQNGGGLPAVLRGRQL